MLFRPVLLQLDCVHFRYARARRADDFRTILHPGMLVRGGVPRAVPAVDGTYSNLGWDL